jgi:hypothetical protein
MDLKKFVLVLNLSVSVRFLIAIERAVLITRMINATPREIARKPSELAVLFFFCNRSVISFWSIFNKSMQKKLTLTSSRVSTLEFRRAQNLVDVVTSKFDQRMSEGFGASLRK